MLNICPTIIRDVIPQSPNASR